MCKQMMLCLVALAFIASSYAQITNPGACPDYPVHMDFDVPAYLGVWYEVQRYDQIFQRNGDCITATYNLRDDGTVQVINSMAILPNVTQGPQFGSAVVSFPDQVPLPGKLNVTFSDTLGE
jgi:apolipoprotein D and lipocalin family protein